jgi:hypothetical protein
MRKARSRCIIVSWRGERRERERGARRQIAVGAGELSALLVVIFLHVSLVASADGKPSEE